MTNTSESIVLTTATFFNNWQPNKENESLLEQVRGNLALKLIRDAARKYRIVVVDGSSSNSAFAGTLYEASQGSDNIIYEAEKTPGMSASRRQAFTHAKDQSGVEVIGWTEPGKLAMVSRDCFEIAAQPVAKGDADIVVPSRYEVDFAGYPDYQKLSEKGANDVFNQILLANGLTGDHLDVFIGPRVFSVRDDIFELFMKVYSVECHEESYPINPSTYSEALFYPLANARKEGYAVSSVEVPFEYPSTQAKIEQTMIDTLVLKRFNQSRIIANDLFELMKLHRGEPARISQV